MMTGRENILSLLCNPRPYVHRQSGPQWFRHPAVSLQSLWGAPGARSQKPRLRAEAQGADPAGGGSGAIGAASRRPCLWRGPTDHCPVARKKAEALPPLSTALLPAEPGDVLELDELRSSVGSKAHARWVWSDLCRQTRPVVAYLVADRSADSTRALRERIPPDSRCRATHSDLWLACDEVFSRCTHRRAGKGAGETCHVERCDCTLRQRLGRFVRKTLSFSRCDRMHELALRLFIHQYNQQSMVVEIGAAGAKRERAVCQRGPSPPNRVGAVARRFEPFGRGVMIIRKTGHYRVTAQRLGIGKIIAPVRRGADDHQYDQPPR